MEVYLTCDTCGEKITAPEEGQIEWFAYNDEKGIHRNSNLRLVHQVTVSPLKRMNLKRKGCGFDLWGGYYPSGSKVESRALSEFLGSDGLMRLLSFIANGEFPVIDVIRLIKRLNVPGYEIARHYIRRAVTEGAILPDVSEEYPEQKDINAVLQWLQQKRKVA